MITNARERTDGKQTPRDVKPGPGAALSSEDAAIVARLRDARLRVREEMAKVIVGQESVIDHLLSACSAADTSSCWESPGWVRP